MSTSLNINMSDEVNDEMKAPKNHGDLPDFYTLIKGLFNPLLRDFGALLVATRKKPQELRQEIIGTFIAKWKANVGNDIYPAFRLILPEQDRERQMYGLKERALARLIVKLLNIPLDSPDAQSLIQWKQGKISSAGNFADRCFEVMEKRETREGHGNMTIGEVNDLLDKLSAESTSDQQLTILKEFYERMNAEEMKWLIRVILRCTYKLSLPKVYVD